MARYRTIKPEFWTSEQVMECSANARLLFIGMWNFADDAGRIPFSPKTLKAQIYPGDEITPETIRGMVVELSSNGLLKPYTVDDKEYLQITGWHHQKIDKPQKPKYPEPFAEHSANDQVTVAPERKKEGKERKENCPVAKATRTKQVYSDEFEQQFWKPYPRTAIMSKKEAWREWMKLGPEQRVASCQALPAYLRHLAQNPTLQAVHACRFLSQNRAEGILELAAERPQFNIRSSMI
jgi:hypothetical protein